MAINSLCRSKERKLNWSLSADQSNISKEYAFMGQHSQRSKHLLITSLNLAMSKARMTISQFTKTIRVIGMFPNKKNQEDCKALSLSKISLSPSLTIFRISLKVRIGIRKWVFHTKEAIFFMALLEQERALLLKQWPHN